MGFLVGVFFLLRKNIRRILANSGGTHAKARDNGVVLRSYMARRSFVNRQLRRGFGTASVLTTSVRTNVGTDVQEETLVEVSKVVKKYGFLLRSLQPQHYWFRCTIFFFSFFFVARVLVVLLDVVLSLNRAVFLLFHTPLYSLFLFFRLLSCDGFCFARLFLYSAGSILASCRLKSFWSWVFAVLAGRNGCQ